MMSWFEDLTKGNPVTDWVGNTSGAIGNATQNVTDWVGNTSGDVAAVVEDVNNAANGFTQAVKNVAAGPMALLKQYWYVPVIVGGVLVGYYLVKKTNSAATMTKLLSQLSR